MTETKLNEKKDIACVRHRTYNACVYTKKKQCLSSLFNGLSGLGKRVILMRVLRMTELFYLC